LDYLRLQYDGQLVNLTDQDSQQAFASYTADAQKRLEHDQQFPDQPKQLRPGEDVQMIDGKVQVSGLVAVMGINELLLQSLMQKNPDLSFAMEESFPLKGTYADAVPLGPLMELRATGQQNQFTQEQASQNLDYWRGISQQVLQDPEAANSETTLRSYSHNVDSAANLLAARGFSAEAEQAYQLSTQLWPGNPESVGHLADLMVASGRSDEARQLLKTYQQNYPAELQDLQRTSSAWHLIFR
jgi:hypothetical protein